jgi:predicted nucleic acid-binding protein
MTLVVDASVAVRWYLPGEGARRAAEILGRDDLIAPDIVIVEIASAVWKRVRKNEVSLGTALEILRRASAAFSTLVPITTLTMEAMRLAVRFDHATYDCLYLALAQRDGSTLVTADAQLAEVAARIGVGIELLA